MLHAGKLRHRITIQRKANVADSSGEVQNEYGSLETEWENYLELWAAVEPFSVRDFAGAREFVSAQSEQTKITARITVRRHTGIVAGMRILHNDEYYYIEGILPDKFSGLEYLTLAVSSGVRA